MAWRAIAIFLMITIALSAIFDGLMIYQGQTKRVLVTAVMWSPGIAAILTCLILKRKISSLPWKWGAWRWNWYAWALPIGYGLAMYLPVWIFGLGGASFGNEETLTRWSSAIVGGEGTSRSAVLFYLLIFGTFGVVRSAANALGEEIGWRGFMIWEFRKVMPFWLIGLGSGLIWGLWHWPAILFTDYNAGEGNFYLQMFLFTVGIAAEGIIYAYFVFRSNSLWPAVILHASHNLFLQTIFTPLTVKGEDTHLYIDEFGIMLPITSTILAVYFYHRAKREGLT
jgi:membrane protease YdiL (CAAX protease family)